MEHLLFQACPNRQEDWRLQCLEETGCEAIVKGVLGAMTAALVFRQPPSWAVYLRAACRSCAVEEG